MVGNGVRVDIGDVLVHEDVIVPAHVHVRVVRLLQAPLGDVDLGGVLDLGGWLPLVRPDHVRPIAVRAPGRSLEAYPETADPGEELDNPHETSL